MNLKDSVFDKRYLQWTLIAFIPHLLGLVLAWNNPHNIYYWGLLSTLLYGYLIGLIVKTVQDLPWKIGYANWVSLIRLGILHVLFIFHATISDIVLLGSFIGILILDGIDGYLARKYHHETRQGAALDNETDAVMTLFLAWIHVSNELIPGWILIPGGLRFLYAWIVFVLPGHNKKDLIPRKIRATISITFLISLFFPFVFKTYAVEILVSVTGSLIIVSFLLSSFLNVFTKLR
ncbi:MAG: CDP-alcohol phosphatidyltransferase family protein [Bacteroidota bacterium]